MSHCSSHRLHSSLASLALVVGVLLFLGTIPSAPVFATGTVPCKTSRDGVNSPGCWKNRPDAELTTLLGGTPTNPLPFPKVCGVEVRTASQAKAILQSNQTPCQKFSRAALTTIFNIRRSILFGDGLLGTEPLKCFCRPDVCIVLCCGNIIVPDPTTPDPNDAFAITQNTSLNDIIKYANQLCELAACPGSSNDPCGKTLTSIAKELDYANQCSTRYGECGVCGKDTTRPTIQCPGAPVEIECTGPLGAPIQYVVTARDSCDPNPSLTCFPPPGTVHPTGSCREVLCTARDASGNEASCTFKVKVIDTQAPTITCPQGPIVVDCVAGGGGNGAVVNYPAPVAVDLCDATPSVTCTPPAGSLFPFGTTTVTCTATDDSGNVARCQFDVIVVAAALPTLTCPGDITVECTGPDGATVNYPAPMVSQTCDPPSGATCSPPSGSIFPIGTTVVTCSVTTSGGQRIECSFKVTVRDTVPPVITCPADQLFECASPDGTTVSYAVSATDTCDEMPALSCDPPSGSIFPVGETLVACRATDAHGNTSTCSFRVIVRDTTPPDITCVTGPVLVDCVVLAPSPGAIVNYPAPSVSDNCDAGVSVTCVPPSGSHFPLGSTTVICTATDANGNRSSCSFEVRVVDSTPPELVCPGNVLAECTSPDGAVVTFPAPMVADACDAQPVVACVPPSGSLFPIGSTTVVCTAVDQSGREMRCEFTVTVRDTVPPQVVCPTDKLVECAGPAGTVVEYQTAVSDNCDPDPSLSCDPPSGSIFPPGTTVVTCLATDRFGNDSQCTFQVHVVDTTPPEIVCPQPMIAECASSGATPVSFTVSVRDVCDAGVRLVCDPPSGSAFPLGTTRVVCVATDAAGNESRCEFEVKVVDTTPPSITCPQDAVTIECTGGNTAPAQYPNPVVSDICDSSPRLECVPPAGTVLGLGMHTVTCTATDAAGNQATCNFQVKVVDTAIPALNCPQDIVRECEGADGALVTYDQPTPTDSCDPAPNLVCLPPSGSVFPIGTTMVVCTADDESGNMVSCSFKVTIVDSIPPVITCPGDILKACESGAGATVTYTVAAMDLCDPNPSVSCVPPSGTLFPNGTTTVLCTARDRFGNSSECSFKVTVSDDVPPRITCPESFEVDCIVAGGARVDYPAPQVSDNCDGTPTVVCNPPSGTILPLGPHVIRCTATDATGNSSSCEFTVTVVDKAPPMLVCPPPRTVECVSPDGTPVEFPLPVATDACDRQPAVSCLPASGSLFAFGSTEVVCQARDQDGNEMVCTFIVTVEDKTPPQLACPSDITVDCASQDGASVTYTVTATDACDRQPVVACSPPSGSLFPIGRTAVTCTATDVNGNRSECTFTVNVVDRTPPEITCPRDLIVEGTTAGTNPHKPPGWPPGHNPPPNLITASVVYENPVASDECQSGDLTVTCNPPNGTRLGFGMHTITCTVRDGAGNESTCTFKVTVVLGERAFIRADSNNDGQADIADPISTINFLFLGGPAPKCDDAADANDDGKVDMADAIYSLNYTFMGGPAPPAPFRPLCGLDPTSDAIGCARYLPCE